MNTAVLKKPRVGTPTEKSDDDRSGYVVAGKSDINPRRPDVIRGIWIRNREGLSLILDECINQTLKISDNYGGVRQVRVPIAEVGDIMDNLHSLNRGGEVPRGYVSKLRQVVDQYYKSS